MERLTFEGNFCDIAQCRELPCKHGGNCTQKEVWERLKQFEDAFGTPENAERVKLAFMGKSVYEIKEFNNVPLARLIELAAADKDGRVLILPAKTVFELTWDAGAGCDLNCPVTVNGQPCCDFCDHGELFVYEAECKQEHIAELGKTVFLTREEAEKALQEMEGKE